MRFVTRKATEPETVIPLATVNFNRLVLVGDHKQVCGGDCDCICRLCVSACVQMCVYYAKHMCPWLIVHAWTKICMFKLSHVCKCFAIYVCTASSNSVIQGCSSRRVREHALLSLFTMSYHVQMAIPWGAQIVAQFL